MKNFKLLIVAFLLVKINLGAYYSQFEQDKFVNELIFKNKKNGVFIDIGAHNGVSFNNSYFFEKNLEWTGICIEPIPEIYNLLVKKRNCKCINGCISNTKGIMPFYRIQGPPGSEMLSGLVDKYDNRHKQRIYDDILVKGGTGSVINVECFLLNDILAINNIHHVDLLSIDTEGGELDILRSIDFSKYVFDVIVVENNYHDPNFSRFLSSKNYSLVKRLVCDEIYIRKELL